MRLGRAISWHGHWWALKQRAWETDCGVASGEGSFEPFHWLDPVNVSEN